MSRATEPQDLKSGRLSSADFARLYEYRQPARKQDLRKPSRSRKSYSRKGARGHSDPTALRAIRRVMFTTQTEGW